MMFSQFLIATLLVCSVCFVQAQRKLVCYYGSWAVYRSGEGSFPIERINPDTCTHIIYAFAGINNDGSVRIIDQWNDVDLGGYKKFTNLTLRNPNLKTLIAIGGSSEGSAKFSSMASTSSSRQRFINTAINLMNTYGFHGIDVDWEYPAQNGGGSSDKTNFATLIRELRNALPVGKLLSIAAGAPQYMVDLSYDVPSISAYVDFINVMTYDFHGSWNSETGANSPLYPSQPNDLFAVSTCMSYWVSKGAPKSKLNVGIPIYGRSFTLTNPAQNYVGAPSTGPGQPGPYTATPGLLGYNEIVLLDASWTRKWDDVQKVPHMFKGYQWVTYDNERSIVEKTAYIKTQNFGGAMVWSIDTDILSVTNNNNPLVPAIKNNLV